MVSVAVPSSVSGLTKTNLFLITQLLAFKAAGTDTAASLLPGKYLIFQEGSQNTLRKKLNRGWREERSTRQQRSDVVINLIQQKRRDFLLP